MRTWCFLLLLLFAWPVAVPAQTCTLMTYNIRLDNPADGPDRWLFRRQALAETVLAYQPQVVGFQEVLKNQLDDLDQALKGYLRYGVGREDGATKGEFSPVYVDTAHFELLQGRTRWMSDTPDTPGKGWDAACERIATMVWLKDRRTADTLLVVNTHWDHIGATARLNSARLIGRDLESALQAGIAVFLMGDLNTEPHTDPVQVLQRLLTDACPEKASGNGTFNGFDVARTSFPRIDYIWYHAGKWEVTDYQTPHPMVNGRHVSDHFPVLVACRRR